MTPMTIRGHRNQVYQPPYSRPCRTNDIHQQGYSQSLSSLWLNYCLSCPKFVQIILPNLILPKSCLLNVNLGKNAEPIRKKQNKTKTIQNKIEITCFQNFLEVLKQVLFVFAFYLIEFTIYRILLWILHFHFFTSVFC